MTAKDKAQELVEKFYFNVLDRDGTGAMNRFEVKQCALIAVDEIIYVAQYECHAPRGYDPHETVEYWEEVKQEIEKL